jgi:DNA primase
MSDQKSRLDIVEVIRPYVDLHQRGREHVGLCPFHNDRHPSLSVNREKGLFHCWSCGAKGDVYEFVMKYEGIGFREVKAHLGISDDPKPRPTLTPAQLQAAQHAAEWMSDQRRKINGLLAEVLEKIELSDELRDNELAETFLREQFFLKQIYEDLDVARYASEFLSVRSTIEALTQGAVVLGRAS